MIKWQKETKAKSRLRSKGEDVIAKFTEMYQNAKTSLYQGQKQGDIDYTIGVALKNKNEYQKISALYEVKYSDVCPWQVIACLHLMESGGDASRQILNGELYWVKTTNVPKNLGPWESLVEACVFALSRKDTPNQWTIPETLNYLERWNGLGYRRLGHPSPYLWSYTNHQLPGKYIKDGVFDEKFISRQVGCVQILKGLNYEAIY